MRRSRSTLGAAEAIAVGRATERGILVQTTHWRRNVRAGIWASWVFGIVALSGLWTIGFEETGRADGPVGRVLGPAIFVLVIAWPVVLGRLLLTRVGLEIGPDGYVARRALRGPFVVRQKGALQCGAVGIFGRMSDGGSSDLSGLAMPGIRGRALPGLVALNRDHLFFPPCQLITRPIRPWYRLRARRSVHDDLIWRPEDASGEAVQLALGFMTPTEITPQDVPPDHFDATVMRATTRVTLTSNQPGRVASRIAALIPLTANLAVLGALAVTDASTGLKVSVVAITVVASLVPMAVLSLRRVTVNSAELRVVNGLIPRRIRIPLQDIRGVGVEPKGQGWAELRLETVAGPLRLRALRFRRLDARQDGDREIGWRCTPYGDGLRRVASPEEAAALLEAVLRSRGWQRDAA